MKDPILVEIREQVFDQFREAKMQFKELQAKRNSLYEKIDEYESSMTRVNNEINKLSRLIHIMISEDIDPVEAKLKYSEKIESPLLDKVDAASGQFASGQLTLMTGLYEKNYQKMFNKS
jgi:chromosome segregation ATPase